MSWNKLNIDLDFLDEESESKAPPKKGVHDWSKNSQNSVSNSDWQGNHQPDSFFQSLKWKVVLIWKAIFVSFWIMVIIFAVVWYSNKSPIKWTSSNLNGSNSLAENTNTDEIITWEYSCSTQHHSAATNIKPDVSENTRLELFTVRIKAMQSDLDFQESEISAYIIDEYSQASIDIYNKKINSYNILLEDIRLNRGSYNSGIEAFNKTVDNYNSYLTNNCRKRY